MDLKLVFRFNKIIGNPNLYDIFKRIVNRFNSLNTLDLIISSLPSQFLDIKSPDRLSDHDIVSGTLKIGIPQLKNLEGKYIVIRRVTMNL